MPKARNVSRGESLCRRLWEGVEQVRRAPRDGARSLPVLRGLDQRSTFYHTQENVLCDVGDILIDSQRVYRHGNAIVIEKTDGEYRELSTLAVEGSPDKKARSILANMFTCEIPSSNPKSPPQQFAPPSQLIDLIVNHEPTLRRLPEIKSYSQRPLFDDNFEYRDSGWHEDVGYLIHSPEIEPVIPVERSPNVRNNIPATLMRVLKGFLFKSDVDLVNVIGILLTGLLVGRFIQTGKPICLLDGNQPGVGKTLLARVVGTILDGVEPNLIHFTTNDEELAKRILSGIRQSRSSLVLIDNAKTKSGMAVSSPAIEANCISPQISLRILGQSFNYTRPNDLLWFLTMNETKTSKDLVSRGVPIRFYCDGDPRAIDFGSDDPLKLAQSQRHQILAELAGLVVRWNQQGRSWEEPSHRLREWGKTIGSILGANGLVGFLQNLDEAEESFDSGLEELAALAEVAIRNFPKMVRGNGNEGESRDDTGAGLKAGEMEQVFRQAKVLEEGLSQAKSKHAIASRIGSFLNPCIDREVVIEVGERIGRATLRRQDVRSNQKVYYFEVQFDREDKQPCEVGDATCQSKTVESEIISVVEGACNATFEASEIDGIAKESQKPGNDEEW